MLKSYVTLQNETLFKRNIIAFVLANDDGIRWTPNPV